MKSRPAHFERLLNFLRRKGRSHEDAEDIIQEAMLRLHRYRCAAQPVVNEEAFLTHAVQNLSIDLHRRVTVRRELSFDRLKPVLIEPLTPEKCVDAEQRLARIGALLEAASIRTREIYFAHRLGVNGCWIPRQFGCDVRIMVERRTIGLRRWVVRTAGRRPRRDPKDAAAGIA